jgi:membrane-bound inhibitor of C-type lysozyme
MKKNLKIMALLLLIVIMAVCAGIFAYYQKYVQKITAIPAVSNVDNKIINSVTFNCAQNKNIKSVFYKDKVDLVLSDGRKMSLPQVLSGSGARYANFDESFVFWNKGDTAFVNEGKETTYKDCIINVKINS